MPLETKPFCSALVHLCHLACTVALLLFSGTSCSEFTGESSVLPFQSSLAPFGTNARIRVEISPGKVLCALHPSASAIGAEPSSAALCAATADGGPQDPFVAVLRAAAPLPVLLLDNGETTPKQLRVRLTNARSDLTPTATLIPLRAQAPRAGSCPGTRNTETYLTPPAELYRAGTARDWAISLPPCASVSVRFALPADLQQTFRLLVAGPNANNDDALDALVADANAWPADHIHFLGGMLNPNAAEPAARLLSLVEPQINVPYSLSLGDPERAAGRDAFYDRFGPADFTSNLGNVRLLALDTSDGELSLDQLDLVGALDPAPAGIAFLFHAPSVPNAISPEGIVSTTRSLQLLERLRSAGIRDLFGVSDRADRTTVNGTELFHLTDPVDDADANFARVTITDAYSDEPQITVELRSAK